MSDVVTMLFNRQSNTWHRLPSVAPEVLSKVVGEPVLMTDMYLEKDHETPICAWRVVPVKPRRGRMHILAFLYTMRDSRVEGFRRKNGIRLLFIEGDEA